MKMEKTQRTDSRILEFFRKHWGVLLAVLAAAVVVGYFVNLIFIQNREKVLSVVVLTALEDTEELEEELAGIVEPDSDERIVIQSIDGENEINIPVISTWIRAGSADVIIGSEKAMDLLAKNGYLKELEPDGGENAADTDYMCGLAEYDDEGNVVGTGEETCFGKYVQKEAGVNIEHPVIATAVNAEHRENAEKVIEVLSGRQE